MGLKVNGRGHKETDSMETGDFGEVDGYPVRSRSFNCDERELILAVKSWLLRGLNHVIMRSRHQETYSNKSSTHKMWPKISKGFF